MRKCKRLECLAKALTRIGKNNYTAPLGRSVIQVFVAETTKELIVIDEAYAVKLLSEVIAGAEKGLRSAKELRDRYTKERDEVNEPIWEMAEDYLADMDHDPERDL